PLSFDHYLNWLNDKKHGPLNYLADERAQKRKNLREVFPECQSALVFLFDYAEKKYALENEELGEAKIASYVMAYDGIDYHYVIRERLEKIAQTLARDLPQLKWQFALDVQPVLERDLALRSGLGWFGRNSMLIH